MKKDWLKDNIRSIIALMTTIVCLGIMGYCALNNVKDSVAQTGANNLLMFVFGYYYSASKDKLPPNIP
jgi:hypothetical protein